MRCWPLWTAKKEGDRLDDRTEIENAARLVRVALVLVANAAPTAAHANTLFVLTVNDLQALNRTTFGAGGPYALDFTLTTGGNTNTVIINGFNLGGGSVNSATISTTGGASGAINSPPGSVTVTDSVIVNPGAGRSMTSTRYSHRARRHFDLT